MNLTFICKKAKIIVPFLLLFVVFSLQAQSVILTGKVFNTKKEPLPGATVIIRELKKGATTDFDGIFKISVPKSTSHLVEVSYVGFNTIKKRVSANEQNITFVLSSEDNVLDEVLVSAVRVKADAPVTHSNLTKKEIAKRNLGQDIPSIVNFMPSVVSTSDAGAGIGYSGIRVRGSDASRVNVTINGIPYNDAESQGTFWVNLGDFASSTQSLQLQRGVGTSTNGSGAFGASLNILTDAVAEEAGGEISNSFGSFGTRKHTLKYTTGKLNNHFELSGRLSKIYSDGYIDRATTNLDAYFLQGSYVDDNTLIKALVFGNKEKTYQAWLGLLREDLEKDRRQNYYTYENETDNYWQDHYQFHWNEKLTDKWSTNVGLNYTRGKGYFEQSKFGEEVISDTNKDGKSDFDNFGGIITPTGVKTKTYDNGIIANIPISDAIVRRWLDNHFFVLNVNATYKNDKLEIIGGTSFSNYTGDHFGEVIWARQFAPTANIGDKYYFNDATKTDYSAFIKTTFSISDKVKAFIDLQGRFIDYKTKGLNSNRSLLNVKKHFDFFNPKAGFTYKLNDNNSLYSSYARANREPNRDDFKNGTKTPETLNDFELGWRFKNSSIKLNTNVFYMNYTNQLVLTGAVDDVGSPIRATSGESYRAGIEIDADISIGNSISIKPNFAYSKNENIDFYTTKNNKPTSLGNTPISYSPDIIAGNIFTVKANRNFQISLLSKFVGEQFLNNVNNEKAVLDSYFVNDLNIVYKIDTEKIFKSIILTGLLNNIFDEEYSSNGYMWGTTPYYFPQAGTNFLLGATLKF